MIPSGSDVSCHLVPPRTPGQPEGYPCFRDPITLTGIDEQAMSSKHVITYASLAAFGGAVVAADPASADADRDNGAVALYGAPRYGRADERAARCVDKELGDRVLSAPEAPHPTGRIFMHTAYIW